MNNIKVLDVTLRDGGCVNDFNFGQEYMDKILTSLELSGVDVIELGYIDEKKGTPKGRTKYCDEVVISEFFLKNKKEDINYVAMIDYGAFNIDKLHMRTESSIDGIRLVFHKKNWKDIIPLGREIIDKGYDLYIQPMLTMRYSDIELLSLIHSVNKELSNAAGFYIVDSFGEMRSNDVVRLLQLVDNNLKGSITLGFHSHNNLQLSYANAMALLKFPTNRNLMLDASVMGMGKGAGNLNTELLLEHLNLYYGKNYEIAPLLELIDQVINVIHKEMYWGYSAEYYLSSINHCTPSYAAHFYNKQMLPISEVAELLSLITENKKVSFDEKYAEELYLEYNLRKSLDDTEVIDRLQEVFKGKRIIIVAPGKSIRENRMTIQNAIDENEVISISLNNFEFTTDFVLITRTEMLKQALKNETTVIAPSNIVKEDDEKINVINYQRWIITGERIQDSSGVIVLQLLSKCNVKEIVLAGFDGFTVNINSNYYERTMRKPVLEEQAINRNKFYKEFIENMKTNMEIKFLTPSRYQE